MNMPQLTPGALQGLRVVEMGQLIAGPFAAKTLGDFGADVIKIEPPGAGDPLRNWRLIQDGTSVWWQVQSRNKRSIALDLRNPEGQDIARALIAQADVLIENFRPGTLEGWGMDYDTLAKTNPGLVMLRISGYGQTGPYRDLPGFGVIGEAMGGLRHLTGEPGRVPVRCGISIGDTLAALHGTIGVLMALYHRKVNGGQGQVIDVALNEAVFNVMESLVPEYSAFGAIREPAGSALPGIAPSNAYRCADGVVLIAGNGDSIFKRLMTCIGRDDLATDAELAILRVLWARGPSTVREVNEALQDGSGYTTVLKLMQIMADKGLVLRDESERSHVYRPRLPESETQRQLVGDLLDRAFGGSAHQLVLRALSAKGTGPVLGLFNPDHVSFEHDRKDDAEPGLPEMARFALAKLEAGKAARGGKGYYLMIEGGAVDWANHANQPDRMIEEQADFLKAVAKLVLTELKKGG